MSSLNQTPSGERLHISVFGRRNAGKSSLANALTGQSLAIVSEVPGTTTDPVAKAMEVLPLGPVVITDTAGIDDEGALGELRVAKTLRVLEKTDLGILVLEAGIAPGKWEQELVKLTTERGIALVVVGSKADNGESLDGARAWAAERRLRFVRVSSSTREGVEDLKRALVAEAPQGFAEPTILGDLVGTGDTVVMVVPIDQAAPKGRLILPQVMAIRDALDHDAMAMVVKERELRACLGGLGGKPKLVVTDSQAFLKVAADTPRNVWMTSFSILMARYKGDLLQFVEGTRALGKLRRGDPVLISEGCTHHKQADDIGTVQIPRWLRQMVGGELEFGFSSGLEFPPDLGKYRLIVHCGGCTLNRREVLYRQRLARAAGIPMTNYGLSLAFVHGILDRALEPFPLVREAWLGAEARERRRVRGARVVE